MAVQASKSISLTDSITGGTLKLSANQIVKFLASGSNTLLAYMTNQDQVVQKLVTQSLATINTAAARTQALTLNDGLSTTVYLHSDKIIFLDTVSAGTNIVYWNPGMAAPENIVVTEAAAAISAAAGNLIAIVTQPTGASPSKTRYINNLFISMVTGEAVGSLPTITFTTRVKTGTGLVTAAGTGYTNPTVTISGGATGTLTTKVVSATIDTAGTGGTPGAAVVTGTTGTGTPFQANVTIGAGGDITSVDSIAVAGDYTVPPTINGEPVTGGGLVGAKLDLSLGLLAFTITATGTGYTAYPTYTVNDATGVNGAVTASNEVESPMTITDAGSNLNTAPTLTFSATTGTLATATTTLDAAAQNISGTTVTQAGAYKKGTDTYPTLIVGGGTGAQIMYDSKMSAYTNLQVEQTAATIQSLINAL